MNEILNATKLLLGIPLEVTDFDSQLVIHINSALASLSQIGVGSTPYQITLETGSFDAFLPSDDYIHGMAQMYIYTKVRLLFDPPSHAFVITALEAQAKELEWRLSDFSYVEPVV
jgi:hypothetical protein